jgi:hypothetical protein
LTTKKCEGCDHHGARQRDGEEQCEIQILQGFTPDKIELTVNGKKITAPNPPAKGIGIEFEITKQNINEILQSGAVTLNTTNTNANVSNTATRR